METLQDLFIVGCLLGAPYLLMRLTQRSAPAAVEPWVLVKFERPLPKQLAGPWLREEIRRSTVVDFSRPMEVQMGWDARADAGKVLRLMDFPGLESLLQAGIEDGIEVIGTKDNKPIEVGGYTLRWRYVKKRTHLICYYQPARGTQTYDQRARS